MFSEIINAINKMKDANLVNEIKKITAIRPTSKELMIHNPTVLPLINKDRRCAVFRIDKTRCVKYYIREGKAEKEYHNLILGAKKGISPQPYEYSRTYVIMEIIDAPTVAEFLASQPITKELSRNLLQLLDDFKEIGFRLDHSLEHIYMMPDHTLKAVNLYYEPSSSRVFPKKMIKGMGNQVDSFLAYVKELNPSLYSQWNTHPEFLEQVEKARNKN